MVQSANIGIQQMRCTLDVDTNNNRRNKIHVKRKNIMHYTEKMSKEKKKKQTDTLSIEKPLCTQNFEFFLHTIHHLQHQGSPAKILQAKTISLIMFDHETSSFTTILLFLWSLVSNRELGVQ